MYFKFVFPTNFRLHSIRLRSQLVFLFSYRCFDVGDMQTHCTWQLDTAIAVYRGGGGRWHEWHQRRTVLGEITRSRWQSSRLSLHLYSRLATTHCLTSAAAAVTMLHSDNDDYNDDVEGV